jgi:hypothetical protein
MAQADEKKPVAPKPLNFKDPARQLVLPESAHIENEIRICNRARILGGFNRVYTGDM